MPLAKQNTVTRMHFTVFDTDGLTPLTGQAGSCTYYLARNGAAAPEAVVISEIGASGHYYGTFTPLITGIYDLEITCPDDRVMGENYEVQAADLDDIVIEVDANETKIDSVKVDTGTTLPTEHANIIVEVDANETKIDAVKVDTTAIELKTDNLPDDPEWFVAKKGLVGVGSTTTVVVTDFTEIDDFFNNMQVVFINSAGVCARNVDDYAQASGAITVVALPFTPANNDVVFVISRTGSVPVNVTGIADAVWDELMAGHTIDGSFGKKLQGIYSSTHLP